MEAKQGLKAAWLSLCGWLSAGQPSRAHQPVQSAPVTAEAPAPAQPGSMQWSKVSAVLAGAIGSAVQAGQLQISAGQQLAAASYALDILKVELAAVLHVSAPPSKPPAIVLLHRPLRVPAKQASLAA